MSAQAAVTLIAFDGPTVDPSMRPGEVGADGVIRATALTIQLWLSQRGFVPDVPIEQKFMRRRKDVTLFVQHIPQPEGA